MVPGGMHIYMQKIWNPSCVISGFEEKTLSLLLTIRYNVDFFFLVDF